MVAEHEEDMTDSQIIQLMGEYHIEEAAIPKLLKELKSKDFEYVLEFVTKYAEEHSPEADRKKTMQEALERSKNMKKEAELNSKYKKMLVEKISANRAEQERKLEIENSELKSSSKADDLDCFLKAKVVVNESSSFLIGLDEKSTVRDLFEKIKAKLQKDTFVLKRFGHTDELEKSDSSIYEKYKAKTMMFEVQY